MGRLEWALSRVAKRTWGVGTSGLAPGAKTLGRRRARSKPMGDRSIRPSLSFSAWRMRRMVAGGGPVCATFLEQPPIRPIGKRKRRVQKRRNQIRGDILQGYRAAFVTGVRKLRLIIEVP